ncbi:MAG TPA: hypothetical protein VHO91_11390 [Rhodopila sp.]|nr:hypothetical protein [Rhodopila sp.]
MLFVLGFPLLLAACSGGPQAWGITGPGGAQAAAPAMPADPQETNAVPGVVTTGPSYGPNNGPTAGSSGYYGYN